MDPNIRKAIYDAVAKEPFARVLNMSLVELELGYAAVEMVYDPEAMNNIYDRAHGGAIFGLIDEAFEAAGQTDGTVAVALSVNVSYIFSPEDGTRLRAEARELNRTKKTANYDIKVTDNKGRLVATCQALAYRTGKPIPFITVKDR